MFDNTSKKSLKVALIAGGTSGERPISLASKDGAKAALEEAGHEVIWLDPAEKSQLAALITDDFDVAFLALHGKGGEDGTIQGFLELAGIPYTGSGVASSAISIDKQKAKLFYQEHAIPTPRSTYIQRGQAYDPAQIVQQLGQKLVVKAATEGSSLGVYITEGQEELQQAIQDGLQIDTAVLIEQYIQGTELTVVVLGAGPTAEVLPIIEIIPQAASYDFDSKYAPGGSEHICPARLTPEQTTRIQQLAKAAHNALGCHGVSRTDFILDANDEAWTLETNTIPGMTATSLLPDAARAAGMTFPELCNRLIESAFEKANASNMSTSS
ncbi:MAG: D-alanine--D-alanine ligase [Eggerthellaceae bacterium]|nr:D-alanine--D-alanine ligase [Eggerthellaceae bacterium]